MSDRAYIGPVEVKRILAVTDALGIHREAVRVPFDTEGSGRAAIEGGRLVIVAPRAVDIEPFISGLRERILAMPGVALLKRAE